MIVLGLTGSIGMGKSTTAAMFEAEGVPVYDSDAAVHALYAAGGAATAFPGVVTDGAIDRAKLSARVVGDPEALAKLEAIVHPLVGAHRIGFFDKARAEGHEIVVLDVPLLFETGGQKSVDKVVVVSAPPEVQRARVLARPEMTPEKFEAILARQLPDAEKRARADFVIDTGRGVDHAREQVRDLLTLVENFPLRLMPEVMAREIILDTETTGFDPKTGDRLVEIGCIEVIDFMPTGRSFHEYCDPLRDMPAEAEKVHGLSSAFLTGKPKFHEIADRFVEFVGDSVVVAHNAAFDRQFVNFELEKCGRAPIHEDRWIDTLAMAKKRFPGMYNSLDALDRTATRSRPLAPRSTDAEREIHAAWVRKNLKDQALWIKFGVVAAEG
ncbi:DNA polymerase III subunit epsilon [Aphelenchoides fujianensis]|nr:DNA polymerase III subunit epsilon [Aphelenchoides fujianensis]